MLHTNRLVNALKHKHSKSTPATHNRGLQTIDAIYVSDTLLDIKITGWLRFCKGVGDHRIAYLDINLEHLIDKDKYEIVTSTAQRLQIKNEDAVRRYTSICEEEFRKHDIIGRIVEIKKRITEGITPEIMDELNEIDKLRSRIVIDAEKNVGN